MKALVIIVNYGTPGHVLTGLETLVPLLRKINNTAHKSSISRNKTECWIVDNCSPDQSVTIIENAINTNSYQDCIHLFTASHNGGFGAGNNLAIKKALSLKEPPDYFYLLNPDAIVMPDTIEKFIRNLDDNPLVGAVGGPLIDHNGNIECGAFRLPNLRGTIEEQLRFGPVSKLWNKYRVPISPPPEVPTAVGWVSGASIMLRRTCLEKTGLFDEGFFLYFEEVDLCRRIKVHGYHVDYLPDADVFHEAGASTRLNLTGVRLPQYWHASRSRYLKKAFGKLGLFIHNVVTILSASLGRVYGFIRSRPVSRPHFIRDIIRYNFAPRSSDYHSQRNKAD